MNAIDMLEEQHREVEDLFEQIEDAEGTAEKRELFAQLADNLAVHATIEERHFYPAVKAKDTEEILLESVEEHLAVKRLIADLLADDIDDDTFEAKVKVLKEQVEHHVEEEEDQLFPKVRKLFDEDALEAIGQEMTATQQELLQQGDPRQAVPAETDKAAPI